uniref:C2H2-type domain-containing protein n=1 Tax=Plectus sambesii TaxID=2011161 RepID=A0A914W820_9BILA
MDDSQIAHVMLPDEQTYQPNFLQGEQLIQYGLPVMQLSGRQQQQHLFGTLNSLMTAERHDAPDISALFLPLPGASSSDIPITTSSSIPSRSLAKEKKPTGSTAARLLAEQYSKNRSSHASQTDSPTTVAAPRVSARIGRMRQRLPPKKDGCLLCQTEVPENQRDRHVLRHHLKKPVYRCPLCTFASIAEPSIVRTHLRLKHREFDLAAVNCRQEFAQELAELTRQCFGPKKRFIRQSVAADSGAAPMNHSKKTKTKSRARAIAVDAVPIECKVCIAQTTVRSDQVKIHVAQCHLHLPYLYGCPKEGCAFGSYTCSKTVKTHVEKEHGLGTKIVSEVKKNRKEMKKSVIECFGESAWIG